MLHPSSDFNAGFNAYGGDSPSQEQKQSSNSNNDRASTSIGGMKQLATFVVGKPVLSVGVVRRITLFPITMKLKSIDSSMYVVPDIPQGPHERSMDTGVKRNQWAHSSSAPVDRRYSELVELREVLVHQFPTIIVPPLPPKSNLENFATFQRNENILLTQQYTIVRFLREVAMIPELMYFSVYMPNFFQMPRETFEDWIETMRTTLEEFRRCNASIDMLSSRKGGLLGSESVTAFTHESTKVMRKIVGIFHSWVGGGEGPQQQTTQKKPRSQASDVNRNSAVMCMDAITYWESQIVFLKAYREALLVASRPYLIFIENSVESVAATKEVVEALERYADVLSASSANEGLARLVREASQFTVESAVATEDLHARNKREMYERMLFEVSYIDAALGAIDHALCIWHYSTTIHEVTEYAKEISCKLRTHYEQQFLSNFRWRMRNMVSRNAESGLNFAKRVEERMKGTNFATTISSASYSEYSV